MISVFSQFDSEEQLKLDESSLGIPSEFLYEGPVRLKISKDEVKQGVARLTNDRLVFF
jgi:hypothetical protein